MAERHGDYPSPSGHDTQHPFYQELRDAVRSQQDDHDEGTQEPAPSSHHQVPDDPQLRANLASMMGNMGANFGSFGSVQHSEAFDNTNDTNNELPPDSIAYRQTSDSPAGPPAQPKNPDKRTKTSRACDECRRKKIRCDAVDENSDMPCTNCARTGASCVFNRQPMKRGPSKGYIKELAERLNSLEQQVQPPHLQQQHEYEIQRVQQAMAAETGGQVHIAPNNGMDPRVGDKRPYAAMDGYQHARNEHGAPWGSANAPQPQQSVGRAAQPNFQTQDATRPFWRHGGPSTRPEPQSLPASSATGNTVAVENYEWDDEVIDEYYRLIHQTFPLLPSNKNRLRQRLADCPTSLRKGFLTALDCLMRTFPTTNLPANENYSAAIKSAAELLARYPFDNPSSHTNATNLVYLQTLLLMALESDNHGPATIRGQAGPSRAEWLGRAAGVAGHLEINILHNGSQSMLEGDRDSEERLARRVWWVLFILDRWHASSTADLLKLPENSVVLLPEDQILLGESTYHLARLSFIIGHLAAILTTTKTPSTDVMAPSNPASSLLGLTLAGEIDRFRESVESVWGSLNLVHLSYHHCHLLIKRLSPTTEPTEVVGHAVKVAMVLNSRQTPVTPLNHHFGALAAMTLCELCDIPKTRSEALKGLENMVECLSQNRGLAGKQESEGWDGAVRKLVEGKKKKLLESAGGLELVALDSAGRERADLRSLADAAVGSGVGGAGIGTAGAGMRDEEFRFDAVGLTRYGYLTALGQGRFKSG
ncbi:hypothetical protein MBLNU230_g8589t1 [Neophaeotheca triangularis]